MDRDKITCSLLSVKAKTKNNLNKKIKKINRKFQFDLIEEKNL